MFASRVLRVAVQNGAKRVVPRMTLARAGNNGQWSQRSQSTYQNVQPRQSSAAVWGAVAIAAAAGSYYVFGSSTTSNNEEVPGSKTVATPAGPQTQLPPNPNPKPLNYEEVYKEIYSILEDPKWDDGSLAPILVRLAWHASGTYDKSAGNGGSNKATMRYKSESEHGGNAGLNHARDYMEKIHQKHPQISYGDLWTLGGVCAIQQMGGPVIPWRAGRTDGVETDATPDGRLPDASKGVPHIRDIFYRMGFNDKDIVILSGAHAIGRCHTTRSGFDGPWTPSPTVFTNDYYKQLLEKTWVERKWNGPKQYQDKETKELMMLPTDMALLEEPGMKKWVEVYAKDEQLFFKDFANTFGKLLELGVPFKKDTKVFNFKTIE